jgi:alkanesulfonate monooxygenase SsuD/methylene tetrahydromethanopterin reductase-like flavin-dependent oxidoreductase (luciferase family)
VVVPGGREAPDRNPEAGEAIASGSQARAPGAPGTTVREWGTHAMTARNPGLLGGNRFKLGVFGANCSSGLSLLNTPDRWPGEWDDNAALARLADEAGIECLVPLQRWKGYGGASDVNSHCLESIAWACGLLALTQHISIFATVHATLLHPVFAAKQMATADAVGRGRFGVNLVPGSNAAEFRMFGQEIDEHLDRYAMAQEWWDVIRRIWSGGDEFDFDGRYFKLKGVIGQPGPYGGRNPPMMNAGASPVGRDFAIRNSDMHYDWCQTPEDSRARIAESKARAAPRTLQVWSPISVVCRPTQAEVDAFLADCVEHADWGAIDRRNASRLAPRGSKSQSPESVEAIRRHEQARAVIARDHYSVFGTPDQVAAELARMSDAGFDGVAMIFVNYLKELPYFVQEVLPRLEHRGLRRPPAAARRASQRYS